MMCLGTDDRTVRLIGVDVEQYRGYVKSDRTVRSSVQPNVNWGESGEFGSGRDGNARRGRASGQYQATPDPGWRPAGVPGARLRRGQHGRDRPQGGGLERNAVRLFRQQGTAVRG